jgi:hypothetical protein
MENTKRILVVGLFVNLIVFFLSVNLLESAPGVYMGQMVGMEFSVLQVRGDDDRISAF